MIVMQIPGKFIYDYESTAESHLLDASRDCGTPYAVSTISKIDNAPRIKRGKGFVVIVELTEDEAKFLKEEALYRYELNGTNEYDVCDKDYVAARAAKQVYDVLEQAGI
jgi:hypothetical protein